MAHRTDEDLIQNEHNTARFFVENRQISWILLIATVALRMISSLFSEEGMLGR